MQMEDSNLTIIMYNARKDQFNVYWWWDQGKLSEKAQEQQREYLLQSWSYPPWSFGSLLLDRQTNGNWLRLLWENKTRVDLSLCYMENKD